MDAYEELIAEAQRRHLASEREPASFDLDAGPEVQLSVRLPAGLRVGVAAAARRRDQTVTTFVIEALTRAVTVEFDSFTGLADTLAREVRRDLAEALADGSYAAAAAEVDRAEAASP